MLENVARGALLALAGAFAAVILEPAVSGFLLGIGIDTDTIAPWMTAATSYLLGQRWFVPVAFLLFGILLGAWIERILRARQETSPRRLHAIANDLRLSVEPLRRAKRTNYRIGGEALKTHAMNYRAALRSLERAGFTVPWIEYEVDPIGFIDLSVEFVDQVAPLLLRDHTTDAKRISQEETDRSKKYMAAREKL